MISSRVLFFRDFFNGKNMLISVKHNFVFLCMPKCASTSSETMLLPHSDIVIVGTPPLRHTNLREYERSIKPFIVEKTGKDTLETVCLIREPVSWLYSWYRFRARAELRNPNHPAHNNSTHGVSFLEFVEAYVSKNKPAFADVGCQYDMLRNEAGENGVEKVFCYNQVNVFVDYMSAKVGKKLILGSENVSPKSIHQNNSIELISSIMRKVMNRLKVEHRVVEKDMSKEIPRPLMTALRENIRQDFEVYERAKNNRFA